MAAVLMIGAAYCMARAASPDRLAPLLAALGLAAGPRFFMFSRRILIDMAVTAAMTLTLLFFVLSEKYPERRRVYLVLMYVCVGVGVLIKGPVAAVLPAMVFFVYLLVHRELRRMRDMMIPTGTAIALAIAAPWYALLYREHGWSYILDFFIGENVGRFTETVGVQTRGPFFYLPVLFSDSLPWSLCLPAVVATWWRERARDRIRTLLLLWIATTVVFFSLSQTKQDLYVFPIVAAVAALGGDWLARSLGPGEARPYVRWVTPTLVTLAIVLVILGAVVLYLFGAAQTVYRTDGARLSGWIAVAGGIAAGAFALRRQYIAGAVAVLLVFIAFNWLLVLRMLPSFERYKPVVPLSRVIAQRATPDDVVAHFDVALPSMVFYLRRHIDIWFDAGVFVQQMQSGRAVYAVLPANRYRELEPEFGVRTCVLARHPTSDIRLRSVLQRQPPPDVLLITNRCGAG
jgi:4-amino-4-deoxy-L-arabinose transferase-like glycosyltransferase